MPGRRAAPDSAQQLNPLRPGYSFNLYLVAGLTPIVHDGDKRFDCEPGELLLFPPGVPPYDGRAADAAEWHHRWVYFRPRGFWADRL